MIHLSSAWPVLAAAIAAFCVSTVAAEHEPPPAVFKQFQNWAEQFVSARAPDQVAALEKQGEMLAAQRRAAMTKLIQSAPQRALELAAPEALRRRLPPSIASCIEQRISGRGDFRVLIADDFARSKSESQRTVTMNGQTYRAFVYGQRADQVSQENVPLHGIVLDDLLAVHESPFRALEAGEPVNPQMPVGNPDLRCPVCGKPASKSIVAESGGRIFHFDRSLCITNAPLK